jgi:hypothetical protein
MAYTHAVFLFKQVKIGGWKPLIFAKCFSWVKIARDPVKDNLT